MIIPWGACLLILRYLWFSKVEELGLVHKEVVLFKSVYKIKTQRGIFHACFFFVTK